MCRPNKIGELLNWACTGYRDNTGKSEAGSRNDVDKLIIRPQNEGDMVISHLRATDDEYYECWVLDPDGNRIEIAE
jgi:hypothetical protein